MQTRHFEVNTGIIFFRILYFILLKPVNVGIFVRYHDLHVGDQLTFA